jgi:hypothetical protein
MNNVIGKLEDNPFINEQKAEMALYKKQTLALVKKWKL